MPDSDNYWDDQDLADFIVEDGNAISAPETASQNAVLAPEDDPVEEDAKPDRISTLTTVHSQKSQTSQILKAHISVLVSALGGPDHSSEQNLYKLGHDALACLKDLKRWIKTVDEQNASFDVALACAETGLVENDLIVILCQWDKPPAGVKRTKSIEKITLACLELLVLLTWPVEINKDTLLKDYTSKTENRRAQLRYKYAALSYQGGKLLKAIIRLGINALRTPKEDREPRDINILRLILFFIRNLLYIEPLPAVKGTKSISNSALLPSGVTMEDISLSTILQVFDRNNVLLFLTSMAHSMSTDLKDESFGLLTMECLSFLTKGVSTQEITNKPGSESIKNVTSVPAASAAAGMGLGDLLSEENRRLKHQNNSISTRHGRFGTLLSIQNSSNASYFAVSGQKALKSNYDTLQRLDKTKNWHKTSTFKYDSNKYITKSHAFLGTKAANILIEFINNFLASGSFNTLVGFVGSHLTNLANDNDMGRRGILDIIDGQELASYFGTISWFFKFKRESMQAHQHGQANDYGSIGASLGETNYILLISYFRSAYGAKDYSSLQVAMVCLREMLLISNAIFAQKKTQREIDLVSEDDINEDKELAEGIIRKLFNQKDFLDLCVNIPKTAARHSPEYLNTTVSVVNILLKSFETLANEDVHLYLKTRRRIRKLKKASGLNTEMDRAYLDMLERDSDEEDDEEQVRYIVQERKMDYKIMEVKFFHSDIVSTHIEFLKNYEDLTHDEIKKGISFFHRLFVVRKDFSALYRLDFMLLLHNLQGFLPKSTSIRRHVDEFLVYFMKKFKGALDRFPTAVEVLFPRIENSEVKGFMSTGDVTDQEKLSANNYFHENSPQPKAAHVLEFIDKNLGLDEQISILIYNIIKNNSTLKMLKHLQSEFQRTLKHLKRKKLPIILRFNLPQRKQVISDPHIRLLLEVAGFEPPFLQNDDTTLTSRDEDHIQTANESIEKWLRLHEAGVGDIEPFLDQLQRVIFSQEELDFGKDSLRELRAGRLIDEEEKNRLEISSSKLMHVIGLAKRKEYDDSIAIQNDDEDDDFIPTTENNSEPTSRRRRAVIDNDEKEAPSSRKRARRQALPDSDEEDAAPMSVISKSAEMVNDSEDDSDDDRNNAFFEKEERLRQLIAQSGGIVDKVQLQLFKESWAAISGSSHGVSQEVKKATSLFLDSDEDSEDQVSTQTDAHSARSRRAIVDSDDDE